MNPTRLPCCLRRCYFRRRRRNLRLRSVESDMTPTVPRALQSVRGRVSNRVARILPAKSLRLPHIPLPSIRPPLRILTMQACRRRRTMQGTTTTLATRNTAPTLPLPLRPPILRLPSLPSSIHRLRRHNLPRRRSPPTRGMGTTHPRRRRRARTRRTILPSSTATTLIRRCGHSIRVTVTHPCIIRTLPTATTGWDARKIGRRWTAQPRQVHEADRLRECSVSVYPFLCLAASAHSLLLDESCFVLALLFLCLWLCRLSCSSCLSYP